MALFLDDAMKDLAHLAVDTAVSSGASYADVRIVRKHTQHIGAEDRRVTGVSDSESLGFGVRVIADGAWGFAASGAVEPDEMSRIAELAVAVARAAATALDEPVELVSEPTRQERFEGPCEVDPFAIPVSEKTGLLLAIHERLLKPDLVTKANSSLFFEVVDRLFASSEGRLLESKVYPTQVSYRATAVDERDARSRSYQPPPRTVGYENVDAQDLLDNADRVAEQAVAHLKARECEPGVKDLVRDPLHLALTMHESIGHATELDRALGFEESLAGGSFATPDRLGTLRYGSPIVNVIADNTLLGGLATLGFDDEGVAGQKWHLIRDGVFVGYGASREIAARIGLDRSVGSCRADAYSSIPIVRQNNFYLEPGREPLSPEELIAGVEDGIYIEGHGSFSIDQKRLNFQFGGDAFWEIKNGQQGSMLKNVTYHAITPEFWGSCDAICDERYFRLEGVMNCGKGDPGQISRMSHGSAPARFRQINVGAATQ